MLGAMFIMISILDRCIVFLWWVTVCVGCDGGEDTGGLLGDSIGVSRCKVHGV